MKSILVIHIWIGKLPTYFNLWRKSCENNSTIDFLLCTDQEVKPSKNFIVQKTDLDDLKKRASSFLGFEACIPHARKLCDYKGIFGYMFPEYASNYDYWGFCDSDLIFGDIRSFITDSILSKYNYILGLGHFHIQKWNLDKYQTALETATGIGKVGYWTDNFDSNKFLIDKGNDYKIVFTNQSNQIFDEFPYGIPARYFELYPEDVWTGFATKERIFEEPDEKICSFKDIFNDDKRYKISFYPKLAKYFPFWNRDISKKRNFKFVESTVYEYNNGKLFKIFNSKKFEIEKREILYLHLIHRTMKVDINNYNKFLIIPNKFIPYKRISLLKLFLINLRIDHKYNIYLTKINNRIKKWKNH